MSTHVHKLNSTAKRYNRTIMDMARCLLAEAKVNRHYLPEVIKTAAYLKNRTLANAIMRKTPHEIFFNRKPFANELKLYGSRIYVRIPEEKKSSKWDKKAELGHSEVGYRVLINNRILVPRHADIIKENMMCVDCDDEDENSDANEGRQSKEVSSESSIDHSKDDV